MSAPVFLQANALKHDGIRHAFFTRGGGVSEGVYATLNGGVGSRDDAAAVHDNRARMAAIMGVAADHLLVPYQIHSAQCDVVDAPFAERPRCDALASATPGLALGVTGADCGMLLFCDPQARVIGAAHSGWKGALNDIIDATLVAMESLGAQRAATHVALGPMIGPKSYEVGAEFRARFVEQDAAHAHFFVPSVKADHSMFDLPGFITMRAHNAGVASFENLALDTYPDEARFFSYRRCTHRGEADYGRLVSAIVLA